MKLIKKIAYILIIIGALNWGLFGLTSIDLVETLFGFVPMLARIIYVVVGLSALYILLEKFATHSGSSCDCVGCDCVDKKENISQKTEEKETETSDII